MLVIRIEPNNLNQEPTKPNAIKNNRKATQHCIDETGGKNLSNPHPIKLTKIPSIAETKPRNLFAFESSASKRLSS